MKLPPFIVTLGTLNIFTAARACSTAKAQTIDGDLRGTGNGLLQWTGKTIAIGSTARSRPACWWSLGLYAVFAYILGNTAWGRHIYAVGDDAEAARLAGIDVTRVLLSAYVVAGLMYGIGGWIQLGRAVAASTNAATDANLDTITAVVIGGTSLFGGRGVLWGTLLGALIVSVSATASRSPGSTRTTAPSPSASW